MVPGLCVLSARTSQAAGHWPIAEYPNRLFVDRVVARCDDQLHRLGGIAWPVHRCRRRVSQSLAAASVAAHSTHLRSRRDPADLAGLPIAEPRLHPGLFEIIVWAV